MLWETVREERLRWFGHVQRRDSGYTGQRMLKIEKKRKTTEENHACIEEGRAEGWCEREGCWGLGKMEGDDLLW